MTKNYQLDMLRDLSDHKTSSFLHQKLIQVAAVIGQNKLKEILAHAYYPNSHFYGSLEAWIEQLSDIATYEEVKTAITSLSVDHLAAGRNVYLFNVIMAHLKHGTFDPKNPFSNGRFVMIYYSSNLGISIGAMYLWDLGYRAISTDPNDETDSETDPFKNRTYMDW